MPEDLTQLRKTVEEGVLAAEKLQKLLAEQKRRERPKLRLIKGGMLGGAIWAGVEWLRNYKIAVALTATAAGVAGGVIADRPHTPGGDPPAQAILKPAEPRPSVPPTSTPRVVVPSPRRTSPPRTAARPTPPKAVETPRVEKTTVKPPPKPPVSRPEPSAPKPVAPTTTKPTLKLPVTKPPVKTTPAPTVSVTVTVPPASPCAVGILDLCILG